MAVPERFGVGRVWWLACLAVVCVVIGVAAGVDPKYGLIAALGFTFAVVTVMDLTLGFVLFTVASFLDVLSGTTSLSATKLIGLVLFGSWLARAATNRSQSGGFVIENPGLAAALAAMLGWIALSFAWAFSPSTALSGALTYLLDMILIPLCYAAIRKREHVVWVVAAFAFGAVMSSVYGFVHPTAITSMDAGRATGLNGDANGEATVLAAAIPLVICLFAVWRDSARLKLASLIAVVLLFAGLVQTLSREGLVSLGAVLVAAVVFGGRWRRAAGVLLVIGALVTVGYFAFFAPAAARDRVTNSDTSGRSSLWKIAGRVFEAHPVLGVGENNFILVEQQYINRPGSISAFYVVDRPLLTHNTFLEALTDLGLPGLLTLLAVLGLCISAAVRATWIFERNGDQDMELMSRGIILALVAILASDFFVAGGTAKFLWIPLALCPVLLRLAREQDENETGDDAEWGEAPPVPVRRRTAGAISAV